MRGGNNSGDPPRRVMSARIGMAENDADVGPGERERTDDGRITRWSEVPPLKPSSALSLYRIKVVRPSDTATGISLDQSHELQWRNRLRHEFVTARAQCTLTRFRIGHRRHGEQRCMSRCGVGAQHPCELASIDLVENDVDQDDAGVTGERDGQRIEAVLGLRDREAEMLQHQALGASALVVIVGDEHHARRATSRRALERGGNESAHAGRTLDSPAALAGRGRRGAARGRRSVNTDPRPTALSTLSWPRIPEANSRLMANPNPVPPKRSSNGAPT